MLKQAAGSVLDTREAYLVKRRSFPDSDVSRFTNDEDSLFEHPAECCAGKVFPQPVGPELLLSPIRQRSIQPVHLVENVPLSGISMRAGRMVGDVGTSQRGIAWNPQ